MFWSTDENNACPDHEEKSMAVWKLAKVFGDVH